MLCCLARTFILWHSLPMMRSMLLSPTPCHPLHPPSSPPSPPPAPPSRPVTHLQSAAVLVCSVSSIAIHISPCAKQAYNNTACITTLMTTDCSASANFKCRRCTCRYHQPVTVEEVIRMFDNSRKFSSTAETSDEDLAVLREVCKHSSLIQSLCH